MTRESRRFWRENTNTERPAAFLETPHLRPQTSSPSSRHHFLQFIPPRAPILVIIISTISPAEMERTRHPQSLPRPSSSRPSLLHHSHNSPTREAISLLCVGMGRERRGLTTTGVVIFLTTEITIASLEDREPSRKS